MRNKRTDEGQVLTSSHDEVRLVKVETTLRKLLSKKKDVWRSRGREEENSKRKEGRRQEETYGGGYLYPSGRRRLDQRSWGMGEAGPHDNGSAPAEISPLHPLESCSVFPQIFVWAFWLRNRLFGVCLGMLSHITTS